MPAGLYVQYWIDVPDTVPEAAWLLGFLAANFAITCFIASRRRIRGRALLYGLILVVGPLYLATFLPSEDGTGMRQHLRFELQRRFNKCGWLLAALTFFMLVWVVANAVLTLGALLVILIRHPIAFNGEVTNDLWPKLIGLATSLFSLLVGIFYFRKVRPRVLGLSRHGRPDHADAT